MSPTIDKLLTENCEANQKALLSLVQITATDFETAKIIYRICDDFYSKGIKSFKLQAFGHKKDFNALDYKTKQHAKPYGDLIFALYNLCKEAHAHGFGRIYPNAGVWFSAILLSLPVLDTEALLYESSDIIEMWESRIRCLKSLEYPAGDFRLKNNPSAYLIQYNPFIKSKQCGAMLLLCEAAYSLAAKNEAFNKMYWLPYIQSQQSIVLMLKTNKFLKHVKLLHDSQEYQEGSTKIDGKKARYQKAKKI